MTARLYRCYACQPGGRVFEGDQPECKKCGANARGGAVLALTLVHWLLPDGPLGHTFGTFQLACDPGRQTLLGLSATHEPYAVTCPRCRKAAGFDEQLAAVCEMNGWPVPAGHESA